MIRLRRVLALPAALAVELGAVILLHRLGAAPGLDAGVMLQPGAAPADALMAAARLAGLVAAWWLLAGTVLSAAAAVTRAPGAVRALARIAPVPIRLLAARAVAATLSVSIAAGGGVPAAADAVPAADLAVPVVHDGVVIPPAATLRGEDAGAAAIGTAPPGGSTGVGASPGAGEVHVVAPGASTGAGEVHVVAPGEHLWAIASARVAAARPRGAGPPPGAAVAVYWLRLVEANRDGLRSGDPDVVHPGERLALPPLRGPASDR